MSTGIWVIAPFTSGRKVRRGAPNPDLKTFDAVVVVAPWKIADVIGTDNPKEVRRILRRMREDGLLICRPGNGRLQHRVVGDDGERFRAYCFACSDPQLVTAAAERIRGPRESTGSKGRLLRQRHARI